MKRQYKVAIQDLRIKLDVLQYTKNHSGGDRDSYLSDIYDETEALMKSATRLLEFHPVVLKKKRTNLGDEQT